VITSTHRFCSVLLLVLLASSAHADEIVVGSKNHRGSFEGYTGDVFKFRLESGKTLKAKRMSVKKLALKKPMKGELARSAKPSRLSVELLGYEKSKFIYRADGTRQEASGMRVKAFTPDHDPQWTLPGSEPKKIPRIDTSRLEAREDLTPEQAAVLDAYTAARNEYDAFLAESSRLVSKLDGKKGLARDKLLEALRRRKQNEQAVQRSLRAAMDDLLAEFPSRRKQ
jgi:hypothetical protein